MKAFLHGVIVKYREAVLALLLQDCSGKPSRNSSRVRAEPEEEFP